MPTLAELAGFFADPQSREEMARRALAMAQSGARGFTTGLLGGPVDIANMAMGGIGGNKPVMGSEWIGGFNVSPPKGVGRHLHCDSGPLQP